MTDIRKNGGGSDTARRTDLKVPPNSIEAEQAILGGLMLDDEAWENIADIILPEDFYRPEHQVIFRVMTNQSNAGKPVDVVTLGEALNDLKELDNVGGIDYLGELVNNARGTANITAYGEIIRERSLLRRLIHVANQIADSGFNPGGRDVDDVINDAEKSVFDIKDSRQTSDEPQAIQPLLKEVVDRIDELVKSDGGLTGLTSGYKDLDAMTNGWQQSDLIIVAGRPSMGKTAFAMNLVENALQQDALPVLVFSLEMPAESLVFRLLSSIGHIDQTRLRNGQLLADDFNKLTTAVNRLKSSQLFIDDTSGISPTELRSRARRVERKHNCKLGLIVVDYLQLMRVKGSENRVGEISEISRSLKQLAKEFKCPVIALSQLNRSLEQRPNKRPVMSDLRESGAIEQDADIITFIYRDEVYDEDTQDKGIAEIIIGKHRNGPIGTVRLSFLGQYTRFENFAQPRYDDSYTHDSY